MMRTLTFTTLYPSAARPGHGIFVETRLRHLLGNGRVETRVVAPVPWFPLPSGRFGGYAAFAATPAAERRFGIDVSHPRYLLAPKMAMHVAPVSLYASSRAHVRRMMMSGYDFDLIDAHYVYPDGVAAVMLARAVGRPVVITARGTDINLIPRYALPRRMIRWALDRADGIVAVSQALKDEMVRLGVGADRITVLRNGVDLELFRPMDRHEARIRLGVEPPVLLMVGNMVAEKGHDRVIRALAAVPNASLLIVGSGCEHEALRRLAQQQGVDRRVHFLGHVSQEQLPPIYSAADVLVLASSREGWPNVLLEAMACATPVAATAVGGTPEVVTAAAAGRLIASATPAVIAGVVNAILADPPRREDTRAYAEGFSWDDTTRGQESLFARILAAKSAGRRHVAPASVS